MKKLLSVLLVVCLLATLCVSFASCNHECEFSADWSKDERSHWHTCTKKRCDKTADKADHVWDGGEITTKATQESDGVRTFTCQTCAQTRTEAVTFEGLSYTEWAAAFDTELFENFVYTETASTTGSGVSVDSEVVYKFTNNAAFVRITAAGQTEESYAPDRTSVEQARTMLINSIAELTPRGSYNYDPETKTYKAKKPIYISSLGASTSDVTLTFADGRPVKIEYSVSFSQSGMSFTATATITLSDFGNVVLNPDA
jgi:hypothetical protein